MTRLETGRLILRPFFQQNILDLSDHGIFLCRDKLQYISKLFAKGV